MNKIQLSTLLCGGALALSLAVPLSGAHAQMMPAPSNQITAAPNALASTQWQLVSPDYAGLTERPTIQFDGARLNASAGLNQLNANYKIKGNKMSVSAVAGTKMAGPPALMNAETKYAKALRNVKTFEISRDGKILSLRGPQVLTFERVGRTLNDPLAQTQWKLSSPTYAGLNEAPTLQFSENRLNASVGLNQINGAYSVNETQLKVSPLAGTKMAGAPALMNAETEYSRALQSAQSFGLTDNGLTLTVRGDITLQFERVNANQIGSDPLAGTQWTVTSPRYAGVQGAPTIRFEQGGVAASVGLNSIGGEYTATADALRVGDLLSTQMAGSPALMAAERQLAKALAGVKNYEISRDGDILSLRGPEVLTLTRAGKIMNHPLTSAQWELTSPGYAGLDQKPTLQFSADRLNASVGLNRMNASYSVDGTNITVSPIASTRMAGPPALMTAENQYAKALQGARTYEVAADGQSLILRGDTTLTFAAKGAMMNNALAQTKWQLATPNYAGIEKAPTLTFNEDKLGASVGLNSMGAGYKTEGDKIELEQFISTMMAGPPALMEAEDAYKKALAGARTFEISADKQTLTLRGETTLVFTSLGSVAMGFVPTETKIINVAPQLGAQFDGDKAPKYLQLEDLSEGVSWGRFTEAKIDGFDFQPGNRYQLRVQVERDARSGQKQLRLLEVVSQKYMAKEELSAGEKVWEIAPTKVDCVGVAPMKCLQVREVGGQWQNFYSPIEGFDFVEGSRYRLQVKVSNIANPPADSSSLRYQLVRVLEKMPVIY